MKKPTIKSKAISLGLACAMAMISLPVYADEIEGNWTTESGDIVAITSCGDNFCIAFTTGEFLGRQLGELSVDGLGYSGTLNVPINDQKIAAEATLSENTLQIKGCAMVVFCKNQTWIKQ